MAPIRVGIIGLGTQKEGFGLGAWGSAVHLPALSALPEYEIVAVNNSTVESAQKSIAAHDLPASVKAYGNQEDLANDTNVDLVVVSVHVQKHAELAKPAILKKKDVFVEWPLGATLKESEELTRLAAEKGVKTAVGAQGHASNVSLKMGEIAAGGKLGRIVSTSVSYPSSLVVKDAWFQGAEYMLDMNSGANEFTVLFGHFLHSFVQVLGGLQQVHAVLKTEHTDIPILGANGEVVNPAYKKTSPDDIYVQGFLSCGAVASINFYKSQVNTAGARSFSWRITGTEGEVELTAPEFGWQMGHPEAQITLKIGKDGEPQKVELEAKNPVIAETVPFAAQNTAQVYDAFAKGDTSRYATFEKATETHRILQRIFEASSRFNGVI